MAELLSFRSLYARDERHTILAGLSLDIQEGEKVVLVGESGCGKTMSTGALLHLLPDDVSVTSGSVLFEGTDVLGCSRRQLDEIYRKIGYVPQNTSDSLHPLLRVSQSMTDAYVSRHGTGRSAACARAAQILSSLGIDDPQRVLRLYPSQLSGGMKQRINIAMALMDDISLLVADEPTSALDIHIRRQIEELYISLAGRKGLAMLVISHDMDFVKRIADRVYVMYAGRIVEEGSADEIFSSPVHPYTRSLIALGRDRGKVRDILHGSGADGYVPDRESPACAFFPRCPFRMTRCSENAGYRSVSETHRVRCVL